MSEVCPAILATSGEDYADQIHRVADFAKRIQIDLMDGQFARNKSIELQDVWWPDGVQADIHLMYQQPEEYLEALLKLEPNMVIVHAEASLRHMYFAARLHVAGIKAGLAILPGTSVDSVEQIINSFDHLLIFSGDLGHFGGKADLSLLAKAQEAKNHHPDLEIGWDGGINDQNAKQIADGGIDVLNVGGFIQNADNASEAYAKLKGVIQGSD
jgi:ribulose-phosphate 3-epimerase